MFIFFKGWVFWEISGEINSNFVAGFELNLLLDHNKPYYKVVDIFYYY